MFIKSFLCFYLFVAVGFFGFIILSNDVSANKSLDVLNPTIDPTSPFTTDDLFAIYNVTLFDGNAIEYIEIRWFINSVHQQQYNNLSKIHSNNTEKGQIWKYKIRAIDELNNSAENESTSVTILNSPPEALSPSFNNSYPYGDEDLLIFFKYFDADGDANERTEIIWYMNGVLMLDFNDKMIIPSNATKKGQKWYFRIRIFDGNDTSEYNESNSVIIHNRRPTIINYYPRESDIVIKETDILNFSIEVNDVDGDKLNYQWTLLNPSTMTKSIVSSESNFTLNTYYDSSGVYIINVTVMDFSIESLEVYHEWKITILNNNRAPVIYITEPLDQNIEINLTESLKFQISYSDPDEEDNITIFWNLDGNKIENNETVYIFVPVYNVIKKHYNVEVTVSDGINISSFVWNISTLNKDSPIDGNSNNNGKDGSVGDGNDDIVDNNYFYKSSFIYLAAIILIIIIFILFIAFIYIFKKRLSN